MIQTIDQAIRKMVAQPLVNALQLDIVRWPAAMERLASSTFLVVSSAIALLFLTSGMPVAAAISVVAGISHIVSIRTNLTMGMLGRDNILGSMLRVARLYETIACLIFLSQLAQHPFGIWTNLMILFMAALLFSSAI